MKGLKPLGIALLLVLWALPVVEFVLRLSACQSDFQGEGGSSDVAVVPSWQTHHQLKPLERITLHREQTASVREPFGAPDESSPDQNADVTFRTSSLGLRGPELEVPKPPGTFRVLCLGDEVLLAARIPEEETLSERLREHLQSVCRLRVEVVNAGVPDFCPLLSFLQFRHELIGLEPDLVIAHFDPSDVWDDRRYRRLTDLGIEQQPLTCVNPSLLSKPRTRPLSENFLFCRWGQCELESMFQSRTSGGSSPSAADPRSKYEWLESESVEQSLQVNLALSPYSHLKTYCEKSGTQLLIVTHPAPWQISPTASTGARRADLNGIFPGTLLDDPAPPEIVKSFARRGGILLCDVTPAIKSAANPDRLFAQESRGFSSDGHQVYAAVLANALVESVPGPWLFSSDRSAPIQTSFEEQSPRRDVESGQPHRLTDHSPEPEPLLQPLQLRQAPQVVLPRFQEQQ